MRIVTLESEISTDEGTFGVLTSDSGFSCSTGELPWRNNDAGKSCIPEGIYTCSLIFSPHFQKNIYHVENVPNRTDVEIHAGNFCGDTDAGYDSDVLGCILLGASVGQLNNRHVPARNQKAVLSSGATLIRFIADMNGENFQLRVIRKG